VSTAQAADLLAAADALIESFGSHDTAAYFDAFAPEASFVFYTTAGRLETREAYERLWHQWEREDGFHVLSCESTDRRVQMLGDVGVFTHSVTTVAESAGERRTTLERETIVFALREGRWLVVHEHLSPDPS
jgi:ketosteroid isomerase-like protein